MPDNVLAKFEGKGFEKLIDVIAQGIGTKHRPKAIVNEADAIAYAITVIGRAETDMIIERNEKLSECDLRIQERWLNQERNRQQNIDNVVQYAIQQYNPETTVSEEPVNEDWTTRFFNIVQDVSDEEMQLLWAKILAGEVKKPKSYSLRTLELLRNLSKEEADVLTLASNFVIHYGKAKFIFKNPNINFWEQYNFKFKDLLLLTELGIVQPSTNLKLELKMCDTEEDNIYISGKYLIKVHKEANATNKEFTTIAFTKVGDELLKLLETEGNKEYLKEFVTYISNENIHIEYTIITGVTKEGYLYEEPWRKFE